MVSEPIKVVDMLPEAEETLIQLAEDPDRTEGRPKILCPYCDGQVALCPHLVNERDIGDLIYSWLCVPCRHCNETGHKHVAPAERRRRCLFQATEYTPTKTGLGDMGRFHAQSYSLQSLPKPLSSNYYEKRANGLFVPSKSAKYAVVYGINEEKLETMVREGQFIKGPRYEIPLNAAADLRDYSTVDIRTTEDFVEYFAKNARKIKLKGET